MFHIKCPLCGGLLTVDPRLRKVVGHVTSEEAQRSPEERFESIIDNIQKAKSEQEKRLEEAKTREAKRKEHIDELFNQAQDKAAKSTDDKPHGRVWD